MCELVSAPITPTFFNTTVVTFICQYKVNIIMNVFNRKLAKKSMSPALDIVTFIICQSMRRHRHN